jgi:hypothetical protein
MTTVQVVKQAFGLWLKSRRIKMVGAAFVLITCLLIGIGLFFGMALGLAALIEKTSSGYCLTCTKIALSASGIAVFLKALEFALSYWLQAATLAQTDRHSASICSGRVVRIMLAGLPGIILAVGSMLSLIYMDALLPYLQNRFALYETWHQGALFVVLMIVVLLSGFYAEWCLLAASQDDAHPKGSFLGFARHAFGRLLVFYFLLTLAAMLLLVSAAFLLPLLMIPLFFFLPFIVFLAGIIAQVFARQIGSLFVLVLYREYQALPARKR